MPSVQSLRHPNSVTVAPLACPLAILAQPSRTRAHHLVPRNHEFDGYDNMANVPEADWPLHAQRNQQRERRGRRMRETGVNSKRCDNGDADGRVVPGVADRSVANESVRRVGKRISQTSARPEVSGVLTQTNRGLLRKELDATSVAGEIPPGLNVGREARDEESSVGSTDSVRTRDLWNVEARYPAGQQHFKGANPGNVDSILTATVDVTVIDVNGQRTSRKQAGTYAGKGRSRDDADYGTDAGSKKAKLPSFVKEGGEIASIASQDSNRRDDGETVCTPADDGSTKEAQLRRTDAESNELSAEQPVTSIEAAPSEARAEKSIEGRSPAAGDYHCDADGDTMLGDGSGLGLEDEVRRRNNSSAVNRRSVTGVAVSKRLDPPPAPFRGTFWDEEDEHNVGQAGTRRGTVEDLEQPEGTRTVAASRRKPRVHAHDTLGNINNCFANKEDLVGDSVSNEGNGDPTTPLKVDSISRNQDDEVEVARGLGGRVSVSGGGEEEDGAALGLTLSDGGLGKRALSCHTKTEENRRDFFEIYRRMARQVCQLVQPFSGSFFLKSYLPA